MINPLASIKNKFFNKGRILRTNRFSVSMNLFSPIGGQMEIMNDEPAFGVSAPSIELLTTKFEFQNVPLQIPRKRQRSNQLLISFYATENMNVYTTLLSLMKQYGGEPIFGDSINRPTAYTPNSLYNRAIRDNNITIRLLTADHRAGGIKRQYDGAVNYINYVDAYPASIMPIDFASTQTSELLTFDVLFNYSYVQTRYEVGLGGTNF